MKAIAAMSLNRVIGVAGGIPWHLPEDFKWFKRMTTGKVVLMGRRTFESLGRPLPNRTNVVVSRTLQPREGVLVLPRLEDFEPGRFSEEVFVIGGAQIYEQLLPRCTDLYLSVVERTVEGDAFFPPFEEGFESCGVVLREPEFQVIHYRHRKTPGV